MLIGSHVPPADPLGSAAAEGADLVQIFLGDPQSWKKPAPREDAEALKASPVPVYVHAPYLINVASPNNKIRIPSRKILQQTCDAAGDGRRHGGDRPRRPRDRRTTTRPTGSPGGARRSSSSSPTCPSTSRTPRAATTQWPATSTRSPGCGSRSATSASASASTPATPGRPARGWSTPSSGSWRITGRIDLVHCNDSHDEAGSGRDRHANLGAGSIDVDLLVAVVQGRRAPVVCETADEGRKDDIALLKDRCTS